MRRSSRLRAKKRVNYGEDSLWEQATKMTMDAWNALVEDAADDPVPMVRKPKPPKQKVKLFKPKPKFRKKLPIKAAKPMVIHKKSSKIEQDEAEIDYSVAEMESAQGRVDRILDQKPQKKKPKKKTESRSWIPLSATPCPENANIFSS